MFNQWDFNRLNFNGGNLAYRSQTSAGIPHIVSQYNYSGLDIGIPEASLNFTGNVLRMSNSAIFGYITATPNVAGGLSIEALNCGTIIVECEQQYDFFGGKDLAHVVNNGPMNFGITCMHSSRILGAASTCYAFQADSINFGNFFRLVKMTSGPSYSYGGSQPSTYTLLATTPSGAWQSGTKQKLELFWFSDPYFLKGTLLICLANDLVIFSIVHTGEEAITYNSSGQGIYAQAGSNVSAVVWHSTTFIKHFVSSVNGVTYPPG